MQECDLRTQLERNHEAAFGWALHCCNHHPAEAEEVLQTAYLKILDGRARFDGRASFRTWLFAVIRHTAADERRRQWLRYTGLVRYERLRPPAEPPPSPTEGLERSQMQQLFRRALDALPRRQREVLHLVFYENLTVQEAAEVMGVSVGSARQHYDRGKHRLRELMNPGEGDYER
jgi:RNA polymerase sigma-70 factor (ECF subfamily)